ncbi:hypothetical protein BDR04DRAFT_414836 [Suillus decipiens]|nr:hypothetical protein BDR04DRAFT_414836 [Suillus decipiens]
MVLFTKFDAFYDIAYAELKLKGVPLKDARELALMHAQESFFGGPQMKFLKDFQWPPKCCMCLFNMNKDGIDCRPLIEHMARILDNEVVKQLFISTQQTNLELCVKYAVENPSHF